MNTPHTSNPRMGTHYPPGHLGLQWWQVVAADLREVAQLISQCEDADRALMRCESREIVDLVEISQGALQGDAIVGVDSSQQVRAVAWVEIAEGSDGTGCARINAFTDPALRGRGIGRAVLKWQDQRARELLAKCLHGNERHARVYNLVDAHVNERRRLYMAAGFSPQRTFEVLTCQLPSPATTENEPLRTAQTNGIEILNWDPCRENEVAELHVNVFDTAWGQRADTEQWWRRSIAAADPRWSFIATNAENQVVGYILASRRPAQWIGTGQADAYGELLAVSPQVRGLGAARALLWKSMQSAHSCGAVSFTLDVDVDNAQGAHEFYRRMGFSAIGQQVYYALDIS
ncbi:MAG: GNAT family N-acetyltransferase [Actinomycetaceae bacterium]|nr:GNAT family N-acetyltransferase [Actinomycetaceae bacterium]